MANITRIAEKVVVEKKRLWGRNANHNEESPAGQEIAVEAGTAGLSSAEAPTSKSPSNIISISRLHYSHTRVSEWTDVFLLGSNTYLIEISMPSLEPKCPERLHSANSVETPEQPQRSSKT